MSKVEVELEVQILNLRYHVRGFAAIGELKLWLDEHASSVQDGANPMGDVPTPLRETAMLRGNGPDVNVPSPVVGAP